MQKKEGNVSFEYLPLSYFSLFLSIYEDLLIYLGLSRDAGLSRPGDRRLSYRSLWLL